MISEDVKNQIIKDYLDNISVSISALATSYGVSQRSITLWLRKAGVEIRKTNGKNFTADIDKINELYNSGKSTYEIARIFDCSSETIRKRIKDIRPETVRNRHSEQTIEKIRNASISLWRQEEYKRKTMDGMQTDEYKQKLSLASKKHQTLRKWVQSAEGRSSISARVRNSWNDKNYREKQRKYFSERIARITTASAKALTDFAKREAWKDKLRQKGNISLPQLRLYEFLRISGVEYYKEGIETKVGPYYTVDCIIPKQHNMQRDLIIEVQGEYWHSLKHIDKQKATYVRKHTDYDLVYISDFNTISYDDTTEFISKYGVNFIKNEFSVKDLTFKAIDYEVANQFFKLHHYLEGTRSGTTHFGAYYKEELVWAIGYATPIRLEISKSLGIPNNALREISRMARLPNIICKNLASYMISRTIKSLLDEVTHIVTFADHTQGHTGGVYKAAGFTYLGDVEPSYYYKSEHGKYHKKTIWDKAKRFKMTESEYAEKHNLVKINTASKARYLLTR